jgi:hypothetical protein
MKRYLLVVALVGVAGLVLTLGESPAADQGGGWGTVKGQVVYGGDLPEAKPLDVNKDQNHCLSQGPILSEDWVVNKNNKGVRWVFVSLAPANRGGKLPIHPNLQQIQNKTVSLDQPCCKFVPHCLGMREGQELEAKNSAPIAHNVNWAGHPLATAGGNQLVPAKQSVVIKDLKAYHIPVKLACNIHPWMSGYVRIYDHPYFAVTDEDGKFELKNVPAGNFRLQIWQEKIGFGPGARDGNPVTIKAGADTDVGKIAIQEGKP